MVAADSDGDGYTDEEELERGTDPKNPLDHPGNLNLKPFGQWQVTREGRWTRFEISNLTARKTTLEVGLIRENGEPLREYPVEIHEGDAGRAATTDSRGRFMLRLRGHESATFALRPSENMDREALFGYGTIRLVEARGSTNTTFLAHGWIRQSESDGTGVSKLAFEGTVVIHGGQPFALQTPLPPRYRTKPRRPGRFKRIRDLGNLMHAVSKGVVRSTRVEKKTDG
jgi:hypothetical protein